MPIWVNGTAVVVGFILLFRLRKVGWTTKDRAFLVYLGSFAALLSYDFLGGGSPWVMLILMLAMGSSWLWARKRGKPPGTDG